MFEDIILAVLGDMDPSMLIAVQWYLLSIAISAVIILIGLGVDFFDDVVEGIVHGAFDVLSIEHVANVDTHGMGSLIMGSFFMSFGAIGVVLTNFNMPMLFSAPISAISAAIISTTVLTISNSIFKEATTSKSLAELSGEKATVLVNIPAGGVGQIQLTQADGVVTLTATSDVDIDAGKTVTINKVVGAKAYVQAQ